MSLLSPVPFLRNRCSQTPLDPPRSHRFFLRPKAFLNQLFHFDQPRLVIRGAEAAMCRETEFGVFFLAGDRYVDPVSGFEVVLDEVSGVFLHHDMNSPPSFEIAFRQEGFACAVYPSGTPRSRATLDNIVKRFSMETVSADELRAWGAARWLDECLESSDDFRGWSLPIMKAAEIPGEVLLEIQSEGFSFSGPFRPNHLDADANRFRISDCRHKTVVFSKATLDVQNLPPMLTRKIR